MKTVDGKFNFKFHANGEKFCVKCKISKNTDEFYKTKAQYDGLQSYCKRCFRKNQLDCKKRKILNDL